MYLNYRHQLQYKHCKYVLNNVVSLYVLNNDEMFNSICILGNIELVSLQWNLLHYQNHFLLHFLCSHCCRQDHFTHRFTTYRFYNLKAFKTLLASNCITFLAVFVNTLEFPQEESLFCSFFLFFGVLLLFGAFFFFQLYFFFNIYQFFSSIRVFG